MFPLYDIPVIPYQVMEAVPPLPEGMEADCFLQGEGTLVPMWQHYLTYALISRAHCFFFPISHLLAPYSNMYFSSSIFL
jgi:hypothetical protein